jgi:hypothetical protein
MEFVFICQSSISQNSSCQLLLFVLVFQRPLIVKTLEGFWQQVLSLTDSHINISFVNERQRIAALLCWSEWVQVACIMETEMCKAEFMLDWQKGVSSWGPPCHKVVFRLRCVQWTLSIEGSNADIRELHLGSKSVCFSHQCLLFLA